MALRLEWMLVALGLWGCHTAGSDWMNQPLPGGNDGWETPPEFRSGPGAVAAGRGVAANQTTSTHAAPSPTTLVGDGRSLGRFRNTYYDFPNESDYGGELVSVMNPSCQPIKQVPVEFHDALCVQGSGNLSSGQTVSFAKRDCECARTCPRTGQKICFEALSRESFPWGRGALGEAITPLLTVAVDDSVIPMHTVLYIPEFDGLPRDASQASFHDGCFVAQDRGSKVKGQHVDVFTGSRSVTELWNRLVPSNQGVTVLLDSPHCARVSASL